MLLETVSPFQERWVIIHKGINIDLLPAFLSQSENFVVVVLDEPLNLRGEGLL